MKRLFAFDLDGTLLTENGTILQSSIDAIKKIIAHGDVAIINTGRTIQMAVRIAKQAGIHEVLICNGALYYNTQTNEKLFQSAIPFENTKYIIEKLTRNNAFAINILAIDGLYTYDFEELEFIETLEMMYADSTFIRFNKHQLDNFINVVSKLDNVLKIGIYPVNFEEAKKIIDELPNDPMMRKFNWFANEKLVGELVNFETSKYSGIQKYVKHFDIDANEVYAFGDDLNDLEMISNVSHGIAMGNAIKEIKAVAKETTSSNMEDGIAKVVNRIYEK